MKLTLLYLGHTFPYWGHKLPLNRLVHHWLWLDTFDPSYFGLQDAGEHSTCLSPLRSVVQTLDPMWESWYMYLLTDGR